MPTCSTKDIENTVFEKWVSIRTQVTMTHKIQFFERHHVQSLHSVSNNFQRVSVAHPLLTINIFNNFISHRWKSFVQIEVLWFSHVRMIYGRKVAVVHCLVAHGFFPFKVLRGMSHESLGISSQSEMDLLLRMWIWGQRWLSLADYLTVKNKI